MSSLMVLPPDADCSITTERLDLHPMIAAHARGMFPIVADRSLHEFIGDVPPKTPRSLARLYGRRESRRSPDGTELWLNWLIRERATRAPIGHAQATIDDSETVVAWLIGTRWQRRGYGSEAARALVAWLDLRGAPDIKACVHPRHIASQRVAHHVGLRQTGVFRDGEEVWARLGPDGEP